MQNRFSTYCLAIVFPLLLISCSSDKTTATDGDIDQENVIEFDAEQWEPEMEPESTESYELWEEGEYTHDVASDSVYSQLNVQHFSRFREDVPIMVNAIHKDVSGGAYFGMEDGISRYNPATGNFEAVALPEGLDSLTVYDITLDQINVPVIVGISNQSDVLFKVQLNMLVPQSGCDIFDMPGSVALRDGTSIYVGTNSGMYVYNDVECTRRNDIEGNIIDMDAAYQNQESLFAVLSNYGTDPDKLWKAEQGIWLDYSSEDGLVEERHRKIAIYMPEKQIWTISRSGVEYLDRQNTLHGFKAEVGKLPADNPFNLKISDSGEVWIANFDMVMRYRQGVSERWDAYYSPRWLKGGEIRSIGFDNEKALWVAHSEGVERFEHLQWTLADKEAYYRQLMKDRHMREGKYIGMCSMESSGDLENCAITFNEQDGFYTSLYSLAMTFRSATLAASGDLSGVSDARKAFEHALEIFTASKENGELGAPATTLVERGTGPIDDQLWFRSDNYDWRGEVDKATMAAYWAAFIFYHQIVADANQQKAVASIVNSFTEKLIADGMKIMEKDGQAASEAQWDYDHTLGDKSGIGGTGALQALALLRGAYALTKNESFIAKFEELADDSGYALATENQRSWTASRLTDYRADMTAYLSYLILAHHENYAKFRANIEKSIAAAWEIDRRRNIPFYDMVYGVFAHHDFELERALETLRDWPLDLIDWRIDTCNRADVVLEEGSGIDGAPMRITEVLPQSQRMLTAVYEDPYLCQWSSQAGETELGGYREFDATMWLLTYWMGRYYGFIE